MNPRSMVRSAAVMAAVAFGVAGCGGGGNDNNNGGQSASSDYSIQNDAFLSQVNTVIAASENSDLVPVDNVTVTTPENVDPAPLI